MRIITIIFLSFFVFSCKNEKNKKETKEKDFQMYEMTEMALLMEKMYHENESLKSKIINNDSLGSFSKDYKIIFSAKMTEPSDNDDFYKEHAQLFIESQQKIYIEKGKEKENFNNMVNSCISCHEMKCTGPIVRIKKLYIK